MKEKNSCLKSIDSELNFFNDLFIVDVDNLIDWSIIEYNKDSFGLMKYKDQGCEKNLMYTLN